MFHGSVSVNSVVWSELLVSPVPQIFGSQLAAGTVKVPSALRDWNMPIAGSNSVE
jgi:hypothetical protein